MSSSARLLTSIYLAAKEFEILSILPSEKLHKTRHYLGKVQGVEVSVDSFEGALQGLIMAKAEFDTADVMANYPVPDFAFREVADDVRYTGGELIKRGLPEGPCRPLMMSVRVSQSCHTFM